MSKESRDVVIGRASDEPPQKLGELELEAIRESIKRLGSMVNNIIVEYEQLKSSIMHMEEHRSSYNRGILMRDDGFKDLCNEWERFYWNNIA